MLLARLQVLQFVAHQQFVEVKLNEGKFTIFSLAAGSRDPRKVRGGSLCGAGDREALPDPCPV